LPELSINRSFLSTGTSSQLKFQSPESKVSKRPIALQPTELAALLLLIAQPVQTIKQQPWLVFDDVFT
jgi:hypothetical protein